MRKFTLCLFFISMFIMFTSSNLKAQYYVSGAEETEINGYYEPYIIEDLSIHSNGACYLHNIETDSKWVIQSKNGPGISYSTNIVSNTPPNMGWHKGGDNDDNYDITIWVTTGNSINYSSDVFFGSALDGTNFNDTLEIYLNTVANPFTGNNGDDFVADEKVTVSNLPEGLTLSIERTSDSTMIAVLSGTATNHTPNDNINNLSFEFQNSAFADRDASEIKYSLMEGLKIKFIGNYIVSDAAQTPEVNGTYGFSGLENTKPVFSKGDYKLGYRGRDDKWVLINNASSSLSNDDCPIYATENSGDTPPYEGWTVGCSDNDTIYVSQENSLVYSTMQIIEASTNNGSISDSIEITYFSTTCDSFTGSNDDDFIADGKVSVSNLPEGLTAVATRLSETNISIAFTGNAINHASFNSIENLGIEFQNSAFSNGNASSINGYLKNGITIQFARTYVALGAETIPEANGRYVECGTINDKPVFVMGDYRLGYNSSSLKWVIVQGDNNDAINSNDEIYYIQNFDDNPPETDWDYYYSSPSEESITIFNGNSIQYNSDVVIESSSNNGTISDSLVIYYFSEINAAFSGANGEDFIAEGKLLVSNLPEGLTALANRTSDTSLVVKFSGAAVNHGYYESISNFAFEFTNDAFNNADISNISNYLKDDITIQYIVTLEVTDARLIPEVNGTYIMLKETYNEGPVYRNGNYLLGYKGCDAKWVIVDGDDYDDIGNDCPVYSTEIDGDFPPYEGWSDEGEGGINNDTIYVYVNNILCYNKTTFEESGINDGSIDNSDVLTITYLDYIDKDVFTGENGDDFVTDGKLIISNLPTGLSVVAERTSDTTLAVIINGKSTTEDIDNLTFTFINEAFTDTEASNVLYSVKDDLEIDFHNEYYVASAGGDFTTITEAVNDGKVEDGDVLILAAEIFTESDIEIAKSLTIKGQGVSKTIVQAHAEPATASDRVFSMSQSFNNRKDIKFENITIQNGNFTHNGGAIYSSYCNLTLENCEISDNSVTTSVGGAIYITNGEFTAKNCTFTNNAIVSTSSFPYYEGGAIYINSSYDSDSAYISNCTFSGNTATTNENHIGGAIYAHHNYLKIVNSTFTNNSAYEGGAIYKGLGILEMVNVLVANNTASNNGNDVYGSVNADYCLIEDVSGATITGSNNIIGVDPELSALDYNGGSTQTHAISATSPAKDAGTNTNVPELDQRGVAIYNGTKDIGTYEYSIDAVIMVSETELDFGNIALNETKEESFIVSAINLTGNVVITAPEGVEISGYSGADFNGSTSITLIPESGIIKDTLIYAQCTPATAGTYENELAFISEGADNVTILVKAKAYTNPEGDDFSTMILENEALHFETADFVFSDEDGDVFAGIQIITSETNGDLEYNGLNVTSGTVCEDISKLAFEPFEDEQGIAYASFTFKVKDNLGSYSEAIYTATIHVNDTPEGSDEIATTDEDVVLNFIADDFTFTNEIGEFDGIQIVSAETAGDLQYDGTEVTANMDCQDISKLVFSSEENIYGEAYATFEFKVKDDLGTFSTDTYTMTINVTAVNDTPVGANEAGTTSEDEEKAFSVNDFTYSDIEGDIFGGISIVSIETAGDLEYDGTDVIASTECADVTKLVFSPIDNENGDAYATFEFKVKDDLGAFSTDTYTMTINVAAVNDAPVVETAIPDAETDEGKTYTYIVPETTFADIDDNVLAYSATLGDNSNLPTWLSFDIATRTFSGTPNATGDITIKVTATDAATANVSDEFVLSVIPTIGVNNVFENSIKVYPNPTSGKITIALDNTNTDLTIIDITGQVILKKTLNDNETVIDLSNQAKGIYLIQLKNNEKVSTKRITIK